MTQPKSESATRAAKRILSEASLRANGTSRGLPGQRGEVVAPLFEVSVLVEGGAGRREQDRISRPGARGRARDGRRHRAAALDGNRPGAGASKRLLDRVRGFADRQDRPGPLRDEGSQTREVPVLVAAPEDQDHAAVRE